MLGLSLSVSPAARGKSRLIRVSAVIPNIQLDDMHTMDLGAQP